jgi:serine/threonine-protein kinase
MKNCPKCHQPFDDSVSFCPRDGEVLQEAEGALVGQVLDGKYEVESFIAQGGMGAVYRARHILLGDKVVIKTLRPEMRGNAEWLRRFQREGRAARSFRHPNAVTVYDMSAAGDGLIYMVMEYVEGHTLKSELGARGRFTPEEALEVLEPVADVLDAAHAGGVVHRDLKPENIMLAGDDGGARSVKVLDLGIAKMLGAAEAHGGEVTSLTVAGQILGTPYYMSPEQWGELQRDGSPEIDGRADVYSLGVIVFELLTGQRPFVGQTLPEIRQGHVSVSLPPVQNYAPDVPAQFVSAVARAMAKDRGDRFQTAGEFINALRVSLGLPERVRPRVSPFVATQTRGGGAARTDAREGNQTSAAAGAAATLVDPDRQTPHDHADTSAQRRGRGTSVMDAPSVAGFEAARQAAAGRTASASQVAPRADVPPPTIDVHRAEPQGASEERRTRLPLALGAAALLLLVGCGVLYVVMIRKGAAKSGEGAKPAAAEAPAAAPSAKAGVLDYWAEAFGVSGNDAARRVAGEALSLRSGEYFQFHFVPRERGYLYIIGPGAAGNAATLFLGAHGGGAIKTNVVAAGADFVFPYGERAALQLDKNAGAEDYTVIFSPTPLVAPAALTREVPYTLKPEELKELEDLRARLKPSAPTLSVAGETEGARSVTVLAPEARDASQPVVFDIRIEHR